MSGEKPTGAAALFRTEDYWAIWLGFQRSALKQLHHSSDWFESVLGPLAIGPIKKLRSWCFVLCFLCIGLSTRFKELATFGMKPFYAFTIGVAVNVPLGYFLSRHVFGGYWSGI